MSRFKVTGTHLEGLKIVERNSIGDSRGFLSRLFCADELHSNGFVKTISQINYSYTEAKATVRGMHYQQQPYQEIKLVSCLRGSVYDVAVDLRPKSPTFLQWFGIELSADNNKALAIPEGFAHGFQTLTDHCELLYCHSAPYAAEAERGVRPNDPKLKINWPLGIQLLSERDANHPILEDSFLGVSL